MERGPVLPCLPGFNFETNIGRTNFRKSQLFDKVHDGVYYLTEKADAGDWARYPAIYPRGEVQELPPWLVYDGQRLMFKAFFQETVHEKPPAPYHVRVVNISFFLEDGTMKVSEPATDNSGLEQGLLVRRQRIPMPDPLGHRYYDIVDLNVGKEPEIFGRVYKIVDCDKFTRRFLNRMGIPVPDPLQIPEDPFVDTRKSALFAKKPNRRVDTRGDFLKYDRKVLRFMAYWDDTDSPHGTIHDLELHYYLSDKTMELKENILPNSGRDTGGMFLSRMKVPKFYSGMNPIGASDPFTVLNVMGDDTAHSYFVVDPLNTGKVPMEIYKDNELGIGAQINVFGRKIVITDMDDFTKEYYRTKYGVNDFTPLERPQRDDEKCHKVEKYIPPYNGFGSYEDSLGYCFSVMPKPPKIDFAKFLNYDKQGFDSHVLRFRANMISKIPENEDRHFIIRFFLMNDTISIFELTKRNSGFRRAPFQKRLPVMLPGQDIFTSKKPDYYKAQDFYVGAILNLCGFIFRLTSADTYALRFMELNCEKFPKANIKLIMKKLREALRPVYKEFLQKFHPEIAKDGKTQVVAYRCLRDALVQYLGDKITEQEIITVARHYSSHEEKKHVTREFVRQLLHTELNRSLWDELDRVEEYLHQWDRGRTGYLTRDTIYTILKGCRIPVDVELINSTLNHICKNEEGKLDYNDLLRFMNTKIDPVTPALPLNYKMSLWWASEKEPDCGTGIIWCPFIKELGLEPEKNETKEEIETKQTPLAIQN